VVEGNCTSNSGGIDDYGSSIKRICNP
jgi:hypothetical protein